ncbi:LysM peptidoglycan-binding domain-containing protein [Phaeocystidibacter luteus]|uniref:LysM peptidoglycan-binding domain-containing protein n=1 Tax=Phaeocystidibacter luteus TaxID=911197 RepID=A0A6N6RM94_9FLAO|nr:LysM peptidoglycan-binding domain-containing protein [Phaeocystidibacter luteus]KAB2814690.1 LysM peptidoglycan-binding domain-containing protein [Phaeocystidibacter luteus]
MRRLYVVILLLLTLASSAQDPEVFLREKGYLVRGMSSLNLPANRKGWWGLSPAIAVKYGLDVSEGFDARMDPYFSTEAAQEWYEDLLERFEDSLLADYAFVYGPAPATRLSFDAVEFIKWKKTIEDWKSMEMDELPDFSDQKEMAVSGSFYWSDVPAVMGWNAADKRFFEVANPGIQNDHLEIDRTAVVRMNPLPTKDQLVQLFELARVKDSTALQGLMATRNRIENDIPDPSTHTRITYRVRSGDYLGVIANRYKVGLSDVKKWNNLRSDMIRVGQELVIYVPRGVDTRVVTAQAAERREGQVRSDEEDREEVQYKVKTGDTLWSIARNYPGISADDIMRWNGIDEGIREGQVLLILVKSSTAQ